MDYYNELYHYGIKGMKWGVRKAVTSGPINGSRHKLRGVTSGTINGKSPKLRGVTSGPINRSAKVNNSANQSDTDREAQRKAKIKKAAIAGAAVAGTALAAYGGYKLSNMAKEKAFTKNYDRATKAVEKLLNDKSSSHISTSIGFYNKKDSHVQDRLVEDAYRYAKRNSSTTKAAVKTLLGKNREFTTAELLNMGIKTSIPDYGWYYTKH